AFLLAAPVALAGAPLDEANTPPAPKPTPSKPLTLELSRPMKWLIDAQGEDGGWGTEKGAPPDVATTAIATISLIRSGHTLSAGEHQDSVRRGVGFIVKAIERVPSATLEIQ